MPSRDAAYASPFAGLERQHRRAAHRERLERAVRGGYVPVGYDRGAWEMVQTIPCDSCGRVAGGFCVTRGGKSLAPSRSHRARWASYWRSRRAAA